MEQFKISMKTLWIKHFIFYKHFVRALAFGNSDVSSLISVFLLIYFIHALRRIVNRLVILRIYCLSGRICREIIFHIVYYYFTKLWFHIMKSLRYFTDYIEDAIKDRDAMKQCPYDLRTIISVCYGMIFTLIFIVTLVYDRSPPARLQYFSWVNGPRRILTEIGSSGRLLVVEEQIPRIKSTHTPPYKSLRSASAEYIKSDIAKAPRFANSEMVMHQNFVPG